MTLFDPKIKDTQCREGPGGLEASYQDPGTSRYYQGPGYLPVLQVLPGSWVPPSTQGTSQYPGTSQYSGYLPVPRVLVLPGTSQYPGSWYYQVPPGTQIQGPPGTSRVPRYRVLGTSQTASRYRVLGTSQTASWRPPGSLPGLLTASLEASW